MELYDSGDIEAARELQEVNRKFRLIVEKHVPIAAQKRLLAMSSGDGRWANVRPPLTALPEAGGEVLAELLRNEIGEHYPEY